MNERRPTTASLPQAIEDAVLQILEGDDARREAELRALLHQHPEHHRTIRAWLAAAGVEVPITVISSSGDGTADGDGDVLPQRLGAYLLTGMLGRGGFGTVYRAEQQEPIQRPVAVKVLNPGMDSREILARFTAEREALNRMDHPGIARLLDAGATPKGRPFFVMELVEGPPLVAHCRHRRLPLRSRLQLFLQVLDAMQHAHQKAVLHRDLSSNNVLVADPDGRAQPKIIDFGIAKSLSSPLLQGGALTFAGTLMGTPEFMSPEQASGRIDDLDTRADVYALGVQLYELLTDQLPIPGVVLRAQGLAGMAHVVRSYQPPLPSNAAPPERRAQLRGDLDAITMKALAKSLDERYGSVAEFAADLRAHLTDQPVQVTPPSTWYRLRKFVRRNRAQTVAAGIVAVGLGLAFVTMLSALAMARRSADEADHQRRLSEQKADAGFLLLANEERLDDALAEERRLPPPWPEHAAAYERWMHRHGEPLLAQHDALRAQLAHMLAPTATKTSADPDDMVARHLRRALGRLEQRMAEFRAADGPLAQVQRRMQLLRDVLGPAEPQHAEAWRAVGAAIHGEREHGYRDYRQLRLEPLPGLVPLGSDPRTKLYEFLDLASHGAGVPLPTRDPATGALQVGVDTGIVFVLLPPNLVELGARRGKPGMRHDDAFAGDDELGGGTVSLGAFLLARTEMTVRQWSHLIGQGHTDDPRLPVTGIDHTRALYTLSRFGMTLPTEAQWEYACRAGSRFAWCSGPAPEHGERHGWLASGPQYPALLPPNDFGLHDLHGNVAEWCLDPWLPYRDSAARRGDGLRQPTTADAITEARVVRGGSWLQGPLSTRATARDGKPPEWRDATIGIRPARRLRP